MKDEIYNMLKKKMTELHQKGWGLSQGMTELFHDEESDETLYNVTFQMFKKGNHEKEQI